MENRHAIRIRNLVIAFWMGFAPPIACVWVLLADRKHWIDEYPTLTIIVIAGFFGPLVFIGWLEHKRRKLKANRNSDARGAGGPSDGQGDS
jgi:hypothetical protein